MEVKAGYKRTEMGVIPEEWNVNTFGKLYADPSRNGIYKSAEHQGRGIRIVNMGEMFALDFISNQEMSRVSLTSKEIATTGLRDGDLLFGRRSVVPAGAGKCSLVIAPIEPLTFESSIIRVRLDQSEADPLFHYYFFASPLGRAVMRNIVSGTNIKGIRGTELRDLKIPRPPLPEQRSIATVLSDMDALLRSLDQLIAKKRDLKQATMQQLLTGKKRLPGFVGEWEVKRLGELLAYEQPTRYLVSSSEYSDANDVPVLTAGKTFVLGYTNEDEGIFTNLPVIIFDDFTTASKFVTFPFKVKSSAMKLLKPCDSSANFRLIYEIMQMIDFKLSEHKRYWISEYQKLEVRVPNSKEQTAIATVLSDMDTELAALEQRRNKTRALKQGMMQELLTGRTRLL